MWLLFQRRACQVAACTSTEYEELRLQTIWMPASTKRLGCEASYLHSISQLGVCPCLPSTRRGRGREKELAIQENQTRPRSPREKAGFATFSMQSSVPLRMPLSEPCRRTPFNENRIQFLRMERACFSIEKLKAVARDQGVYQG